MSLPIYEQRIDEKATHEQPYQPSPTAVLVQDPSAMHRERRCSRRRRFGRFVMSLLFFVFIWHVAHMHRARTPSSANHLKSKFFGDLVTVAPAFTDSYGGKAISECSNAGTGATIQDSEGLYTAHQNFDLPIGSDMQFYEVVGNRRVRGSLTVSQVDHEDDMPPIHAVDITAKHGSLDVLKGTTACLTHFDGNVLLMLSVPDQTSNADGVADLEIDIHIKLPSDPVFTPELKFNLPNFVHVLGPMSTELNSVEILSHDSMIINNGIAVRDFKVTSKNSPISGFFNVSSSLKLITSNAPIDVTVDAYHTSHHWPTNIRLLTSNAELNANISLFNTTEHSWFHVLATTSNSPTNVELLSSPLSGRLRIGTSTSNAPARLALGAEFEGYYGAHSYGSDAVIERREGVEDPTGQGRERTVETNYQKPGTTAGAVYWGTDRGHHLNHNAHVATSNKPATLVL